VPQRARSSCDLSTPDRWAIVATLGRSARRWSAGLLVAGVVLAGCAGGDDGPSGDAGADATSASAPSNTAGPTTDETTAAPTTPAPFQLPALGPESAVGTGLPDGIYAATLNSVDAENASLGLNLVTVSDQGGVPIATDEDPLGLVDRPTNGDTEILLLPTEGGGLRPATQRELWNTMGKKDTGFAVGDSSVLFFTIEGGTIVKVEQQPYIALQ
jgi:hypothetical protein